jgi:hypothetical protein
VTVVEAVPLAEAPAPVKTPAVPVTLAEPSVVVPDLKVTVPVGPTPLLPVAIVAVKVTVCPTGMVVTLLVTVEVVVALVTVTGSADDVLVV